MNALKFNQNDVMTFAYSAGRFISRNPWKLAVLALGGIGALPYIYTDDKPDPIAAPISAARPEQETPAANLLKNQCDADKDKRATTLKTSNTPQSVIDVLRPCEKYLNEIERDRLKEARTKEFDRQAKQVQKALAEQDKKDKAEKRSHGVSIGMSKDDVLASSWGRPKKINATINRYARNEQWVYGTRSYLYFEDDVLVSIQTGN